MLVFRVLLKEATIMSLHYWGIMTKLGGNADIIKFSTLMLLASTVAGLRKL